MIGLVLFLSAMTTYVKYESDFLKESPLIQYFAHTATKPMIYCASHEQNFLFSNSDHSLNQETIIQEGALAPSLL